MLAKLISVVCVQHKFKQFYKRNVPMTQIILWWYKDFQETDTFISPPT